MNDDITIEPAAANARPCYFVRNDNRIYGSARVTDLAQVGSGETASFWVIVEFEGQPAWVLSDRLRNRQQFERQSKPKVVELVREPR